MPNKKKKYGSWNQAKAPSSKKKERELQKKTDEELVREYEAKVEKAFQALPEEDQDIIVDISELITQLSDKGMDYFELYLQ